MSELDKLIPALIKFQTVVKSPAKTKTNPHLKNKYADLSDIVDVVRGPLAENGLAISQLVCDNAVTTMLLHESGQYLSATTTLTLERPTMQGLGSAITYARRYALSAILGIVADDDDDGHAASTTTPAKQNTPASAPPAAPNDGCSEPQRKKIFAMIGELKWDNTKAKSFLKEMVGVDSSKDLTKEQAKKVIDLLEKESEGAK
jgi:hypothetical protein